MGRVRKLVSIALLYSKHPPLIYMKTKLKCGSDKASHINEVVINVWYNRLYREVNPNKNCIKENQTRRLKLI